MGNSLTRRQFLKVTAAGGALLATHTVAGSVIAAKDDAWPKLSPVKIYKVYAGRTGDFYLARPSEEVAKFEQYLKELEKKLGDVKFVGGDLVPPADVDQVAAKLKEADGLLLIHLSGHGGDAPVLGKLMRRGPAHGAVLAALQRPRLDVLPASGTSRARRSCSCPPATGASSRRWSACCACRPG